jgi:alpha-glucan, water dikinase
MSACAPAVCLMFPATLSLPGLYDSVAVRPLATRTINYAAERLLWDARFCEELLRGIADVARAVEAAFGGKPQDIEGVYKDGKFVVVQARPQVI